jgi:hypothetical protein
MSHTMQVRLWHLAARTTALPMGRGALTLGTSHLLLTEPVPIPKLVLSGRVPQQDNHTIRCGTFTALRTATHCSPVLSPARPWVT